MFQYSGKAILDKSGFRGVNSNVSGDVMVDFESYYKHGLASAQIADFDISEETTDCKCPNCTSNSALQNIFRTRWGKETKGMLHGLIKDQGNSESEDGQTGYDLNDIVAEKGKGLVILLYGPPGVGKTSTVHVVHSAQTMASAARKPLFPIGVADVGTTAGLVESNLETIFDLATTWKAVLLIDEADVFLQSRGRGQIGPTTERNALVSVFLRVLEYYQGILILTTNQISQFDVAVQSRFHIAIRYEGLDKKQTVTIFRGFLEQYKARGLVQHQIFKKIMDWVERDLSKRNFDGRQIRNIVTSAMGIALADEDRELVGLTIEDLQSVVAYISNFKGDLEYQMRAYNDAQKSGPSYS
ncbi:P-loop containing nucleoside triphosphate hydrolase protein [Lentinula aciculospora]|uniref:P-loop containing nucleoside triphosphate hydrolase protein n=1 Tax=Lentinula aciculospora TaxID=153920 RepID=A0A9W9DXM2_9AGAR|nr:P-loop containing nucleoside triphosphate hydrolase protein [Lentinula aciculospora]